MKSQPGLGAPGIVDAVAYEEKSAIYRLVLVVDAPWDHSTAQLKALQEKLNAYIGFALDGAMAEAYAGSEGKDVAIRVQCVDAPSGRTAATLAKMEQAIRDLGLGLEIAPRRPDA